MSTSIRPPGGPAATGPVGLEELPETHAGHATRATMGTSAAPSVEQAAASAVQGSSVQGSHGSQGSTAALLSRLDAGEVTREQALEALVSQALEAHGGAGLPPSQRAELAGIFRSALLDDPALSRLLGG